jgi:hypothetical protein
MKFKKSGCFLTMIASAASLLCTPILRAADHADAPLMAHDAACDIGDVYAFCDPTDNTQTVLIATVHGFIVPGEVANFAAFDEKVRYRFEIYNDHVNLDSPALDPEASRGEKAAYLKKVKPNRTIDITFGKRQVGPDPQTNPPASPNPNVPTNLRRPLRQEAKIVLGGFPSSFKIKNKGTFTEDTGGAPLLVSPFGVGPSAPPFDVKTVDVTDSPDVGGDGEIQFFAGEVDDPFFFDIPAFSQFLDTVRTGSVSAASFSRARDTFAGYNILAIAVRIPSALLQGTNGTKIGVDFLAQRHATQTVSKKGVKGVGSFKTLDREGNPAVNVVLVPFDAKDAYNAGTVKDDVSLKFAGAAIQTLKDLGIVTDPPETAFLTLANIAIAKGDLLQLDLAVANTGTNPEAAFPNGRRLQDDIIDTYLTVLNHFSALGDNVNNGGPLTITFPFLGAPNQPRFDGAADDTTRN